MDLSVINQLNSLLPNRKTVIVGGLFMFMLAYLCCCPLNQAKKIILQSMIGIGKIASASIISNLSELGYMTSKQATSLVGVAPLNRETSRYKGLRKIQGGRHQVRTVLYMAMMSAIQSNPVFKATYQRLVAAGKPKKVTIIACIRKMGVILNSMLRDGVMWEAPTATN